MKFKNIALLASAFAAILGLSSCKFDAKDITKQIKEQAENEDYRDSEKWGKVVENTLDLNDFTSIKIMGNANVKFYQSDTVRIEVLGNEKAIGYNEISVINDTLTVNQKEKTPNNTPSILLRVYAPSVANVDVYGAGYVKFKTDVKLKNDLSINIYGAGYFDAEELACSNFKATIQGAGDIYAEEIECTGVDILVNGAGKISSDFDSNDIKVVLNGAGKARLDVNCNNLDVEANGVGDVKVKGECVMFNKSESAMGSIDSRELTMNKTNIK